MKKPSTIYAVVVMLLFLLFSVFHFAYGKLEAALLFLVLANLVATDYRVDNLTYQIAKARGQV